MTVGELLSRGKTLLKNCGVENYSNEARWIFESVFDCGKEYAYLHSDDEANEAKSREYLEKINSRISGTPVQYVIGSWDFYGESFLVGNGVLIPRPETELLVDFALDYLSDKSEPVVFDLCAGSGCIGLSVAAHMPNARVFLVEKYPEAFNYLSKNLSRLGCSNAKAVLGDISDGFAAFDLPKPELILSNPPYIESACLPKLQREVQLEPATALDGGESGYDFYEIISQKWLPSCYGAAVVECGEGQAEFIKSLFSHWFAETKTLVDFNGIERAVVGTERNKNVI